MASKGALARYIFGDINCPNFAFALDFFCKWHLSLYIYTLYFKIYFQRNLVFNFREILYVYLRLPTQLLA